MRFREDAELMAFFDYIRLHEIKEPYLKSIYHIGNERKTSFQAGIRLKRKGVRKGVPDVCVPISNKKYNSLYIEFKIKPNKLNDSQKEFGELLIKNNNLVCIAYSAIEAINILRNYLNT